MKVVIAGAGEVGTHLARMLTNENHDITLLDDSPEKLANISSEVDLMTIAGSAHSFQDLKSTDLAKSDLFIAVTPFEERNVLACSMASYLGVNRTIARINNSEYLQERYRSKLNNLGINELIYPESLAAKEIIASVKQTATRQLIEFSGGKLIMMGIKVRENAPVLNKTFEELSQENQHLLVVAINRDNETIIPNGSDFIKNGDIVFFVTTPAEQNNVYELTGKTLFEVKNIMFLGGSRIAQKAIEKLGENYRIKVIEGDRKRCEKIADKYENVLVINGDGRNLNLLREEGIEKMDAFVATTGNSETNILGCHLAKTFGVRRTVAEVENLAYMNLADNMDIGSIFNKKLIAAGYIYRFTLNAEISKVKCLTASDAEVFEFIAKPGAKITQKPIKDLDFPDEAKIGGVIRGNMGYIAHGYTQIQEGDKVVVFTLPSGIKKLEKFFK
ncbi:trk system potassium uptake protein TrkA [Draconibacterium orientale]|uniref:Trk system potassium uptake protein TrkA n=1 Tax=Draconibacterium orientale TaxID=1168034 RepID=X5E0L7_9BACT|nr:Trk system potassium transporter TrkA [Draconibacterium orientale]AHW60106.1 potassium transporter TrkA [Draconibacterium orientale]SET61968.1 trk system potassium uptake protein TrkA [Draconibacterium orientale]